MQRRTRRTTTVIAIGLFSLVAMGSAPNDETRWTAQDRTSDAYRWTSSAWRVEASGMAATNRDVALTGPVRAVSETTHVLAATGAFEDGQLVLNDATVSGNDWQIRAARVLITPEQDGLVLHTVSTKRSRPSTDAARE